MNACSRSTILDGASGMTYIPDSMFGTSSPGVKTVVGADRRYSIDCRFRSHQCDDAQQLAVILVVFGPARLLHLNRREIKSFPWVSTGCRGRQRNGWGNAPAGSRKASSATRSASEPRIRRRERSPMTSSSRSRRSQPIVDEIDCLLA